MIDDGNNEPQVGSREERGAEPRGTVLSLGTGVY